MVRSEEVDVWSPGELAALALLSSRMRPAKVEGRSDSATILLDPLPMLVAAEREHTL